MRLSTPFPTRATTVLLLVMCACGGNNTDPFQPAVEQVACEPLGTLSFFPTLPLREGPPAVTTGEVPHQQLNAETTPEVIAELYSRIFALDSLEERASILGMAGTRAIWLTEDVTISRPECVPGGREFAHIHVDGSLHSVLPHERIPEAVAAGWAEPHPFAGVRPGFEAFVMLFTPRSPVEVDLIFQFILEALNFITG